VRGAAAGFVVALIVLLVAAAAGARGGAGSTAPAAGGGPQQPLGIRSASLAQAGQQFVWRVALAQPFSPGAPASRLRSLCLLFERVASASVRGQLCLAAPAPHSTAPRLVFTNLMSGGSAPGQVIAATVAWTSPSDLQASFLPAAVDLGYGPIRWQVISTLRGAACAPRTPSAGCSVLFPAQPTLLKLHTPVVVGCVPSGPSLVYHGPAGDREIALPFDDGPWNDPPTADFLSVLERAHVPATFFEIGRQIGPYDPGGVAERRMLADGDMIGDHTWSHPDMALLPPVQQALQLIQTASAIRQSTGFTPCLWRPPGGAISPSLVSLARSLGFLTVMWNVDPRDWALPGVGAIYSNVVSNAHSGSIVIQHFGGGPRYETLAALPQEISTLRARGYRFVTVNQMLGLKLVYR
jgi:peptidoglycan/xylan/chitin deacetylase (PgdA/CDA1 family)